MVDPLADTQIQEESDELIDSVVADKYRVVRRIGKGGFGAVYEVRHVELPKRFAMKVLLPELSARADVVRRFRNEAMAASAIGHEHIVEVIDLGVLPSRSHYLLLEFLEGQDFAHVIEREGPLTLGRTARILTQVCEALSVAHAKGIVHRDLKPENIFLLNNRRQPDFVKLLDFGISKLSDELKGGIETESHVILGTPYFMAPEQLNASKNVDARADMYSLGVILYRALTGQFPFGGASFGAIVVEVMTQPIPDVRALRPDLPEELTRVVEGLLAKSRDDRTPDCQTLLEQLAPFVAFDRAPTVVPDPAAALAPTLEAPRSAVGLARPATAVAVAALNDSTASTTTEAPARRTPTSAPWMIAALLAVATIGTAITVANRREPGPVGAPLVVPPQATVAPAATIPQAIPAPAVAASTVASSAIVPDASAPTTQSVRSRRHRVGRDNVEVAASAQASSATQAAPVAPAANHAAAPTVTTTSAATTTSASNNAARRAINLDDPPPSSLEGSQ